MISNDLTSVPSVPPGQFTDRLRLAVAAYLAASRGSSREHTESDLRRYLTWCAEHDLDPLTVHRPDLELYVRWMGNSQVQALHHLPAVLRHGRVLSDLRH
jgi:hypothetical protein